MVVGAANKKAPIPVKTGLTGRMEKMMARQVKLRPAAVTAFAGICCACDGM